MNAHSFFPPNESHPATGRGAVRYAHELFFSLNLAFGFMAIFIYDMPAGFERRAMNLDLFLNRLLHIRETDLLTFGWSFSLSGIVIALIVWVLLQLVSRTEIADAVLRSIGGILAISAAPSWYIWATYHGDSTSGYHWPVIGHSESYEFLVAVICMCLFLKGKLHLPRPVSFMILMGHYVFWLWLYRFQFRYIVQAGARSEDFTLVFGLLAGIAWTIYVSHGSARNA